MLFIEVGSIVDGIDGELARLRCHSSKLGQWMDTVTDDIANLCYWTGVMWSLDGAGVDWALPLWGAAAGCFVITQSIQYYLIATVYNSGDLAAIPWAMQSKEFLEQRPTGLIPRIKAGFPKLFKRDFAVTMFVVMALAGFLEGILVISAAGAIVFFCMMMVQLVRRGISSRLSPPDTVSAGSAPAGRRARP
jgi:phosphatidylglycerophosphate synthase